MLAPLENGGARAIFKFILLQNARAPFTKKLQFFLERFRRGGVYDLTTTERPK
jgi:hypothetical protein